MTAIRIKPKFEPYCDCSEGRRDGLSRCTACGRPVDAVHISEEEKERSLRSTKPKKPLYCIAFVNKRTGRGELLYTHAESDSEARRQYFLSERPKVMVHLELVGVAPVIGYHVNDNKGDDLSV